jgi:putative peptidoglycan lipid II flippase
MPAEQADPAVRAALTEQAGAGAAPPAERAVLETRIEPGAAAPAERAGPAVGRAEPATGTERFIARAAAVTAALTVAGAVLGLVRDQLVARLFGAGGETDAFLIAWTVPEFAATLLIEDAMALVMIPAFSLALSRRAARAPGGPRASDPVGRLVSATAPRLLLALGCAAVLVAVAAPRLVRLLAPGLAAPGLAVECTRLTAVTILGFGAAGYLSAALRAHRRFLPPAAVYVAYNTGIIATVLAAHHLWGVRAAAAGVAIGSLLMVLVQLPACVRHLTGSGGPGAPGGLPPGLRRRAARLLGWGAPARGVREAGGGRTGGGCGTTPRTRVSRVSRAALRAGPAVLAPVVLFAVTRQAQVLVERHLASSLPAGAISHLNYAQKVAQVPMVLSLMVVTVTFPLVARAMADGEAERARRRIERDLTLAGLLVLLGTAYVVAYAPHLVELLFQRGAFDAHDTAATASVMRVYALGLLGHSLTGALIRPFFSAARPTWHPAAAMAVGLLITVLAAGAARPYWGIHGIAAANAAGITATALILLRGLGAHVISIRLRRVSVGLLRLALAALAATAAGRLTAPLVPSAAGTAAVGCLVVPLTFAVTALALRAPEVRPLISAVERKLRHAR